MLSAGDWPLASSLRGARAVEQDLVRRGGAASGSGLQGSAVEAADEGQGETSGATSRYRTAAHAVFDNLRSNPGAHEHKQRRAQVKDVQIRERPP